MTPQELRAQMRLNPTTVPISPDMAGAQDDRQSFTQSPPDAKATTTTTTTTNVAEPILADNSEPRQQQKQQAQQTTYRPYDAKNLDELIKQVSGRVRAYTPMSDADMAKYRKRQAIKESIAGVHDLGMAIANLFLTKKGYPVKMDPTKTMTAQMQARHDKELANIKERESQWLNYALLHNKLLGQRQSANAAAEEKDYKRKQDEKANDLAWKKLDLAQLKAESDAAKAAAYTEYMQKRGDREGYLAELARLEQEYAAKTGQLMSRTRTGGSGTGGSRKQWEVANDDFAYLQANGLPTSVKVDKEVAVPRPDGTSRVKSVTSTTRKMTPNEAHAAAEKHRKEADQKKKNKGYAADLKL